MNPNFIKDHFSISRTVYQEIGLQTTNDPAHDKFKK